MRRFLVLLLLVLVAAPALAAPNTTPIFPGTIVVSKVHILDTTGAVAIAADGASVTNSVLLYTCDADGSKITSLLVGSTDTAAREVLVVVVNTSKPYVVAQITVPITAGTVAGTPAVNALAAAVVPLPSDSDGNPYLFCGSGDTIRVGATATLTADKIITVTANGADF